MGEHITISIYDTETAIYFIRCFQAETQNHRGPISISFSFTIFYIFFPWKHRHIFCHKNNLMDFLGFFLDFKIILTLWAIHVLLNFILSREVVVTVFVLLICKILLIYYPFMILLYSSP